jgi:hypothetical protein
VLQHLPYRIEYVQTAINHLRYLTARQRSVVFTGVDQQLMHEPTAETRNRKQMRANPLASWELRLGDLRVYYDRGRATRAACQNRGNRHQGRQ